MEEKKTLKIKKPRLIIFALAIAFAIMGFIDLKVNAAELTTHTVVVNSNEYRYKDGVLVDGYPQISDELILTSNEPIYAYYYTTFESPSSGDVIKNLEFISRSAITNSNGSSSASFAYNGETWYIYQFYQLTGFSSPYTGYFEFGITGAEKIYKLNQPYDLQNFITALNKGTLKFEEIIDYDTSKYVYDDTMPVPEDISHSIEVIHTSDDDAYTRFVLVNWKNTSNEYYIEVQLQPYANISSMYLPFGHLISGEKFKADYEFYGDWEYFDLLEKGTSRKFYPVNQLLYDNLEYLDWFQELKNTYYTSYMKNVEGKRFNTGLSYRIRYVDVANKKAGKWLSVVMSDYYDGFHVFVQDDLGNTLDESEFENGFVNVQDQLGSSDSIDTDIVKDNANDRQDYFDKYGGVSNGDIDFNGATNWLTSVANFIKGTPDFVGSVMSFLPEPVRYGMFVCLFLGVIASGYAIVKALI